jgi:hypothetical protein
MSVVEVGDVNGEVSYTEMNVAHAETPPVRLSLEAVLGMMRGWDWSSVPRPRNGTP